MSADLCVPNIMSFGIYFKNCTLLKLVRLLDKSSKYALFSVSGLRRKVDKKKLKKQT